MTYLISFQLLFLDFCTDKRFVNLKYITMKSIIKILVPVLFMTGTYGFLNAQIGLGIRGGVSFANAELRENINGSWNSDYKDFVPRTSVGLIGEFGITDMFAVQPEVNFIQKGYKTTVQNEITHDYKVLLNYVEVPVLFKGKFGTEMLKLNVVLGPTFGYAFNGKTDHNGTKTDINFSNDQIKQYDYGVTVGLGVSVKAGPGDIFLDGRANIGLNNLNDAANADNYVWNNRGFNVGIGYIFHLVE